MMNREELIQAYFERSLIPEEQQRFDQLMQEDVSFQERIAFEKDVQAVSQIEARQSLKNRLKKIPINQGDQFEPSVRVNPLYFRLAGVAAVAAVVVLMWTVFSPAQPLSSDMLYARYFKPYDNVVQPLERSDALESLEKQAFEAYELGEYKQADSLFTALQENNDLHYFTFYRGISLMQLDDLEEAERAFNNYLEKGGKLEARARWYLALCYLKMDQTEKARTLLKQLQEQEGYKAMEAEELLELMN